MTQLLTETILTTIAQNQQYCWYLVIFQPQVQALQKCLHANYGTLMHDLVFYHSG